MREDICAIMIFATQVLVYWYQMQLENDFINNYFIFIKNWGKNPQLFQSELISFRMTSFSVFFFRGRLVFYNMKLVWCQLVEPLWAEVLALI
jgi:hypothetical protein